jgi:hypothetical protein
MSRVLLIVALSIGCTNPHTVAPPDMAEMPSPSPTPPPGVQIPNGGGPTLSSMKVWTVVWQGDEAEGKHAAEFTDWLLAKSDYWLSNAEYGAGRGKSLGLLVIPSPTPSPIPDALISKLIEDNIAGGAWAAPDAETVYSFLLPLHAVSTNEVPFHQQGCGDYIAYHQETRNTHQAYAVTLRCGLPTLDDYSFQLSHELVETAGDPLPHAQPAWIFSHPPLGPETENADLCYPLAISEPAPLGGLPAVAVGLARFYSNRLAALGGDPCAPLPKGQSYAGVTLDPVKLDANGHADALLRAFDASGGSDPIQWSLVPYNLKAKPSAGKLAPGESITISFDALAGGAGAVQIHSTRGNQETYFIGELDR